MSAKTVVKSVIAIGLVAIIVYALGACATVFKGIREPVDFDSNPMGAEVHVNGSYTGKTPLTVELESKRMYTIEFRKEGYEPEVYTITNHIGAGWIVLDVLFGLVPVVVDAATGAWFRLDEDSVNAVLKKQR